MLPAGSRLRRRADFTAALRGARGTRGGGLVVVHVDVAPAGEIAPAGAVTPAGAARSRPGQAPARVGLVVPRAVGPAVTRNLVKRRLRHVLARRLPELPAGSRVVVRALPAAASASSTQLDAAVGRALVGKARS